MDVIEEEAVPVAEETEERRSSGSSDEFGDDDFDADMVEALDISQAMQPTTNNDHVQVEQHNPAPPIQPQQAQPPPPAPAALDEGSDDEFGLDDEQEFAADLEQVASLYDSRPEAAAEEAQVAPSHEQEQPVNDVAPVINLDDDDDDEFGDDIDPDEFAAAELQATQGHNTVCRAQANVS
jgi:DNA replication ATP-dependent helicase Dna2